MANKQIKDFDLKESIDGLEDLLIQDSNGITKRIKTSKLMGNLDLSNYYTKAEVDDLLADTDLSIDMADYYDKATIDNLLAKKANVTHAHSYNDLTDKPSIPSIDGLATKEELTEGLATKANVSHTHDQYLTEHQDLSDYALKTELPTVPTKVSELANDSGFIKSIPSEYVTETELNAKGYLTSHQDISMKADKSEIPSLEGYATETFVTNKIAEASLSGGEVDLSGLATKDELALKADTSSIPTKTSELTNDSGFLTSHQDVSGKADKTYVVAELAKKPNESHTHSYNDLTDKPTIPSTTNLATKKELTDGLATKSDATHNHDKVYAPITHEHKQYLTSHQDLSGYALKTEIPTVPTKTSQLTNDSGFIKSIPSEYITETELSAKSYATETYVTNEIAKASLSGGEVDLSEYATKEELATKADKTAIPTKTSQLTNDSGFLTEHQDISGLATKTELTNGLKTKSDTTHNHDAVYSKTNHTHSQYLTEHQDISMKADKSELHSHANKTVLDSITSSKVTEWNNKSNFDGNYNSLTNKPTIPTVPTNVSSFTNDAGYLTSIPSEYVTETELNDAISGLGGGTGNVSSDVIRSIMVVDALPEVELEGVLYLVKETTTEPEPEPTVTNLYPSQTTSTISDGFTITFAERNVTIDGSKDTGSVLGQTEEFDMNLKANKTYYLQFTNVSGSFDDSKRVSQNDGMIYNVQLKSYDSSHTPRMLIDQVERDASGLYNKFTFTPEVDSIKCRLIIQAKKLMTFSNWTCSIVIAEEGD